MEVRSPDFMSKNPHRPTLIFVGEPFDGRTCELVQETTSVGRSSQNHLCIQDASVSARHCEILANGAEILVRDLNSSNGTFINAVRISGQAQVKHGQILRIGNVNARLELAQPEGGETASDMTAVYQHAKAVQEARREREQPQSAPQPVKLDAGSAAAPAEHTVTLSRADAGAPQPAPTASTPPANAPKAPARGNAARLIWAAVMLGIAIALFFLFRK